MSETGPEQSSETTASRGAERSHRAQTGQADQAGQTDQAGQSRAVVDLLGILGYGALSAFHRLAEDAGDAPTLADKVMLASLASVQFNHFDRVRTHLLESEVDVMDAMEPFYRPFDAYHEFTRPRSWLEGLVKSYVGDGFAADFYREVAVQVDPATQDLVFEVLADDRTGDYVVGRVREHIAENPRLAGPLALWARRLVGEALSQAQRVAGEHPAMTELLTGTSERPGMDLVGISALFSRLTENHALRMERLGLAS